MAAVKIVTDSTADLDELYLNKYNISLVPLQIRFNEETYKDRVEITPAEFYERLKINKTASTSQPSPADIYQVYKKLSDQGDSIISLHISSDLSGTYQAALLAKSMLPDADIHVIDSRTVSVGLGLVVLAAAKAAQQNKDVAEIIALVNDTIPKVKIYFVVDTLEYLARGGRIGKAASLLGSLLNIKPVLGVLDGIVQPVEKVRGKNRAIKQIIELVKAETNGGKGSFIAAHAGNQEGFGNFVEKLQAEVKCEELLFGELGPVVGCHGGPGLVGVAFYRH